MSQQELLSSGAPESLASCWPAPWRGRRRSWWSCPCEGRGGSDGAVMCCVWTNLSPSKPPVLVTSRERWFSCRGRGSWSRSSRPCWWRCTGHWDRSHWASRGCHYQDWVDETVEVGGHHHVPQQLAMVGPQHQPAQHEDDGVRPPADEKCCRHINSLRSQGKRNKDKVPGFCLKVSL